MWDFEVERVRIQMQKENQSSGGAIFAGEDVINIDDRIPLSVRGKPFIEWIRWINKYNSNHPDNPIPHPEKVYKATI